MVKFEIPMVKELFKSSGDGTRRICPQGGTGFVGGIFVTGVPGYALVNRGRSVVSRAVVVGSVGLAVTLLGPVVVMFGAFVVFWGPAVVSVAGGGVVGGARDPRKTSQCRPVHRGPQLQL